MKKLRNLKEVFIVVGITFIVILSLVFYYKPSPMQSGRVTDKSLIAFCNNKDMQQIEIDGKKYAISIFSYYKAEVGDLVDFETIGYEWGCQYKVISYIAVQ